MLLSYWCEKCKEFREYEEPGISFQDALEIDPCDMEDRDCPICGERMMFNEVF